MPLSDGSVIVITMTTTKTHTITVGGRTIKTRTDRALIVVAYREHDYYKVYEAGEFYAAVVTTEDREEAERVMAAGEGRRIETFYGYIEVVKRTDSKEAAAAAGRKRGGKFVIYHTERGEFV